MKIASYKSAKVGWMLDYNESKIQTGAAARIGGNVAGNKQVLERVFNHFAHQRESAGLKNRFIHLKLSLSPLDNHISSRTFRSIVAKTLQGLGLTNNPNMIYRHYDTDHPHVHVIISRITFDGQLIRDSFDGLILKRLEQELDKEFALTASYHRLLSAVGVRLPQKWERERSERTNLKSVRNYIQCGIIESLQRQPSLVVFVKRLERRGIKIWHREIQRGSRLHHGLNYSLDPQILTTSFKDTSTAASVGGIDVSSLGTVSKEESLRIPNRFFGTIGQLITNLRGIPEFCMNLLRPDDHMKGYSFRAANLGPYFQYASIIGQLSHIDADTLEHITLRVKKPSPQDYNRVALTTDEKKLTKLIIAAEIQSESRVNEALSEGLKWSDVQQLDRATTPAETHFIQAVLQANEQRNKKRDPAATKAIAVYSDLVLQYRKLTGSMPGKPTITAIGLIAEEKWEELQNMLSSVSENNERAHAPDPSIMYLGIPTALSFTMMDYHRWYTNEEVALITDEESAKRKKKQRDTEALLQALKMFDQPKVKEILDKGEPDVTKIPLEQLGKATDPELAARLKKLAYPDTVEEKPVQAMPAVEKHHYENQQQQSKDKGYELG